MNRLRQHSVVDDTLRDLPADDLRSGCASPSSSASYSLCADAGNHMVQQSCSLPGRFAVTISEQPRLGVLIFDLVGGSDQRARRYSAH